VTANIAEGTKRHGQIDFARFLNIAEGSLAETECLVIIARDLRYLADHSATAVLQQIDEIARMLYALRTKVEQNER
jgi:four helix bundle protein